MASDRGEGDRHPCQLVQRAAGRRAELWRSDGTKAGTVRVKRFAPSDSDYGGGRLANLTAVGDTFVVHMDREALNDLRRELITVRRAVWPVREMLSQLERSESALLDQGLKLYLRDAYDHTVQVIDIIETFRDLASGRWFVDGIYD